MNMQARLHAGMDTLAKRVRSARKYRKLSQDELAELSGLKQPDISKIERGDILKTTGLLALARALRCAPDWLDTGDGDSGLEEIEGRTARPANPPLADVLQSLSIHLKAMDADTRHQAMLLISSLESAPDTHTTVAAMIDLSIHSKDRKAA